MGEAYSRRLVRSVARLMCLVSWQVVGLRRCAFRFRIMMMYHVRYECEPTQGDAILNQGNGHDDAGNQDDNEQNALVELGLGKFGIGSLDLEE